MSWGRSILFGIAIVLSLTRLTFAQQTKPPVLKPVITSTTPTPTTPVIDPGKRSTPAPVPASPSPSPSPPTTTGKTPTVVTPPTPVSVPGKTPTPPTVATPPIPPPPPPPLPSVLRETPNNPLASPPNIDDLLRLRMTEDIWTAMYSPLSCLDVTPDCIAKLQQEAVQNSPVIRELEAKIATVNEKIEEAQTNNKKSIDLSIFEPGLQVFLKQETVVENGQSRKVGFIERVGQIFSNPGSLLNDLLGAIGIPILRGSFGGNDAQQSRAIQISDLTVKVAEMERIKTEIGAKTREKVQQLILEFDVLAREFQAEQAIAQTETKSFKLYAVTYAAGDGDTNIYLNRKGQLDRTKLQVFKNWARVRGQITAIKTVVVPRDTGG
jgi:hypothetical protein